MPASAQHPFPGDGFPGGPAHRTSPLATATAPSTGTQDLDEILDWEIEALPRQEDPYQSYCEESEPRDEGEWLEESYILAAPGVSRPEDFAWTEPRMPWPRARPWPSWPMVSSGMGWVSWMMIS